MRIMLLVVASLCVCTYINAQDISPAAPPGTHAEKANEHSPTVSDSQQSSETRLQEIEKELTTLKVSKDYFSSILSAQLVIFSTIVVVLVAISWGISYFRAKAEVRKEFEKEKANVDEWKRELSEAQDKRLEEKLDEFKTRVTFLDASINRAFATTNKSSPAVAYIWWLRAASSFHATGNNPELTRICLESVAEALVSLQHRHEIFNEMGEIHDLLDPLDEQIYSYELKIVRENIDRIYSTSVSTG